MRWYFKDQFFRFEKHLDFYKGRSVMDYDKNQLIHKSTSIKIDTNKKLTCLNLEFLFDYKIFPDGIMSYLTQWTVENRKMQVGDTIIQQVYLPPSKLFSQKIVLAVRINEIIDQPEKIGFSYETLEGHVEKGVSIFTVEEREDEIIFKIQTYSKPGNILTKILGPIFSIPYQTFCTKAALENVKRQCELDE